MSQAYTFRSVGTYSSNNGVLSPGAPAGRQVGDLLLLQSCIRDKNQSVTTPTGWTLISPSVHVTWNNLYARIADGTATDVPTLTYTGSANAGAQIAAFSGSVYSTLASIVSSSVDQFLSGSQTWIEYSALGVLAANCLIVAVGTKNKTATSDGTTINTLSGFTKISGHDGAPANGTDISEWWGYQQQTTATNIAAVNQTLTGTTETLQYTSLLVALLPAPASGVAPAVFNRSQQG